MLLISQSMEMCSLADSGLGLPDQGGAQAEGNVLAA